MVDDAAGSPVAVALAWGTVPVDDKGCYWVRHTKHKVLNIATYDPADGFWRGLATLKTDEMVNWGMEWWPEAIQEPPMD